MKQTIYAIDGEDLEPAESLYERATAVSVFEVNPDTYVFPAVRIKDGGACIQLTENEARLLSEVLIKHFGQ